MAWRIDMVFCDRNKCYLRVGEILNYKMGEEMFSSRIEKIKVTQEIEFVEGSFRHKEPEPRFYTELHKDIPITPGQITEVDRIKYIHE